MKRTAMRKDFYMEIRKSRGRFISILFIILLGVAFFSGIRASEPSMRITGDTYFDDSNLMDIKAFSTFGVTEDDVAAIGEIEGVKLIEGAYSTDFLQEANNEQKVLHVQSMLQEMNQLIVDEGRLPEKPGECLADNQMGYEVGDIIELKSGNEDKVTDTLKVDTLEVVGIGSSAEYISFNRGSTTIGTGNINGFLAVTEDSFDMEVYTELYVQVEGAKELVTYTDEYDELIENVLERIEAEAEVRGVIRKQEIVDEATEELNEAKEELADAKKELADAKLEVEQKLADARAKIADGEKELKDAKKKISDGKSQLKKARKTLTSKEKELKEAESEYNSGLKKYKSGKEEYDKGLKDFKKQKRSAEAEIKSGREQMAGLLALIEGEKQQLTGLQTKIEAGLATAEEQTLAAELSVKIPQEEAVYTQTTEQLDAAEAELAAAEKTLSDTEKQLKTSKKELDKAKKQISTGKKQIESGWKEIEESEEELKDGQAEIEKNEKKIEDAKADYREGEKEAKEEIAEAEVKIADGEEEVADAEAEIADIEEPKWYVYDRSTLPEHVGLGDNAARIGAIGKVFPIIFFLVAAMISLTCMTRMVEEQRMIIGTLKALGYGKFSIAFKYLGYALFATVGGSIAGVLIGEKVIPWIIIFAYSIIYPNLPEILTPYEAYFAMLASGAAIMCTTVATMFACYKELEAQPAVLMRPPSPKKGKRVLLERIPFIWKRLNFLWKSTVRNLFRYKKRFLMTIFGISGCMALLIVGFGLKDSIFEISALQYTDIQIYDGMIHQQEDLTEEELGELESYLAKNSEITRFKNIAMTNVTLKNGKNEYQAYQIIFGDVSDIEQYVKFRDRETKEPYELTNDGVIISEKTAKLLEAGIGDTIEIKDEDEGNKEVVIENICENYMGHYMYYTKEYYEKVYGETPEYNCILFETKEGYTVEEIEEVGRDVLGRDEVLSVSYMHDIQEELDNMLGSLNLVIIVLIVSAGMLAFVVLYNLNTVNITERKRELATLKVLGFFDSEVATYVYRENILLTFIGAFFGVFFGKVLHSFIIQTVEVDAAMFGRVIKPISYGYSLVFTVAFSLFVNWVMYFKLKKIDMVESLKSVE